MKGIFSVFESDTKRIKLLIVFFLIIYHFALFYSLSNEPVLLSDSKEYLSAAQNFNSARNFYSGNNNEAIDYRMFTKRTPFYPLVISAFYSLNWHKNYIYILQLFLGLFNIFLGFFVLKKLINSNSISISIFAIFVALTPSQFIYSQFVMADLWLQTFVMLCALFVLKFYETKKPQLLFYILIYSVFAALTKPVFLFASFGLAIWCLYQLIKLKSPKYLLLMVLLPFLSWFMVSNLNKKNTGVFHYSSIGYINLLHYNTNIFLTQKYGKIKTAEKLEPLMIVPHSKLEFAKNYREVNKVCRIALSENIVHYTVFHCKGMIYFFVDPGRFDIYNFFRLEDSNSQGFLN